MKVAGVASALLFLVAVSALRLGDKPLFSKKGQSEAFAEAKKGAAKEALAAGRAKYKAPQLQ